MSGPLSIPRGARLFLTGGTGFVGRSILRFLGRGYRPDDVRITVLTRDPEGFAERCPELARSVDLVGGDVRAFDVPGTFTHVIHAATATALDAPGDELVSTVVDGTARVIEFADACGARKLLLVSSGAVYGRQPPGLETLDEDYDGAPDLADPASAYGNAKRLAEQLCARAAGRGGADVTIARPFTFAGEDLPLDGRFAIGNFIRDALAGGPIRVTGDGSAVRSYLYQDDLAEWLLEILERGRSGRAYNVGSDQAINIAKLAHLVADLVCPGATVRIAAEPDAAPATRYVPSIRRACAELGLAPRVPLAQAIRLASTRLRR